MAWLQTSLLDHVQLAGLFPDSKHFVDMSIRTSLAAVLEEWREAAELAARQTKGGPQHQEHLTSFVSRHFQDASRDIEDLLLPAGDEPDFLKAVEPAEVAEFGAQVHRLWQVLLRKVARSVVEEPLHHTLLALPHPFIIPGDRFREVYYWDSYWIILGLLSSGLPDIAVGLTENLLTLVDRYGYVPNGSRTYYLNRSQPPLLSCMVAACPDAAGCCTRLRPAPLPRLLRPWQYWTLGSGGKALLVAGPSGHVHKLSRYYADWDSPRPESYREDVEAAAFLESESDRRRMYRDIASAAESGWDFSSRWFADGRHLASIRTTQVVPVDLNGFLLLTARHIAGFAAEAGDADTAATFRRHAADLAVAMDELMWSDDSGCWQDLLLVHAQPKSRPSSAPSSSVSTPPLPAVTAPSPAAAAEGPPRNVWATERLQGTYASNWVPLWCGCCEPGSARARAAVQGLKSSGLIAAGGILTSLYSTGQQWDAPNAWAPLQHMIIAGLNSSGVLEGETLAVELAATWIRSNFEAYCSTGHMHEKYNALQPGVAGGGGEYAPQVGFGWSNGVLLDLLRMYPTCLRDAGIGCVSVAVHDGASNG